MVHEVPRGNVRTGKAQAASVVLSEDLTPLDVATDRFLREQMLLPALATARDIIHVDEGDDHVVPRAVRAILDDVDNLPDSSREIAQHLFESQTGSASAGIFLASIAEVDGLTTLILLKAEHQEGVRLRQTGTTEHVAFSVEHITELIVGKNSRVYKIAVLWVRENDDRVVGLMVDKQNGVAFADYFLDRFLGMQLRYQSEVLTREFVDAASEHINSLAVSPEKRPRYTTALTAVLESPEEEIDVPRFIRTFIDVEDRDAFVDAIPPAASTPFAKDIRLVTGQIGGLRMDMEGGEVQIRASKFAIDEEQVRVEPDHPDGPRVVVSGLPESVKPARAPHGGG